MMLPVDGMDVNSWKMDPVEEATLCQDLMDEQEVGDMRLHAAWAHALPADDRKSCLRVTKSIVDESNFYHDRLLPDVGSQDFADIRCTN